MQLELKTMDYIVFGVVLVGVLLCGIFYMNGVLVLEQCNSHYQKAIDEKLSKMPGWAGTVPSFNTTETMPVFNISRWS